jgi:hypothetical protein
MVPIAGIHWGRRNVTSPFPGRLMTEIDWRSAAMIQIAPSGSGWNWTEALPRFQERAPGDCSRLEISRVARPIKSVSINLIVCAPTAWMYSTLAPSGDH